jgi:hypothetical protein
VHHDQPIGKVSSPVMAAVSGPVRVHPHRRRMIELPRSFPSRRSVARRLNDEWQRITADPATAARMASWPSDLARYGDATRLLDAIGREGGLSMAASDHLLAVLIGVARTDTLAARIVLQRVIPGLVNAAVRRTSGRPDERQQMFDDLVATAWLVIRTFPIERRPAKIAVNVLRDAEYMTCVRPVRLRSSGELPVSGRPDDVHTGPCGLDGTGAGRQPAAIELASVLRLGAESGVCRRDLAMLVAGSLEGHSAAEVARRFGVTVRTVRNRRVRTTAALAALVAA